jgi:hypothetical protein
MFLDALQISTRSFSMPITVPVTCHPGKKFLAASTSQQIRKIGFALKANVIKNGDQHSQFSKGIHDGGPG